jgi:hypothetical protein
MSEWKESAARRRDVRHAKDPKETVKAGPGRKDTKRWCRGKVGVPHKAKLVLVGQISPALTITEWQRYECAECGKKLWLLLRPGPGKGPAWVTR